MWTHNRSLSALCIFHLNGCLEWLFSLRVLAYQPSVCLPNVQALDSSYLTSTLPDYAVPFHSSTLATIPTDPQSESAVLIRPVIQDWSGVHFLSSPFRSGYVFFHSRPPGMCFLMLEGVLCDIGSFTSSKLICIFRPHFVLVFLAFLIPFGVTGWLLEPISATYGPVLMAKSISIWEFCTLLKGSSIVL